MSEEIEIVNHRSSSSNSMDMKTLMEAEKKSFYARKNANDILLKYTGNSYELPDDYSLDERDDANSKDDDTTEGKDIIYNELADYPFQIIPFDRGEEDSFKEEKYVGVTSERFEDSDERDQVFDNYRLDESTKEDIDQIGRCINHFSHSASVQRNRKSKISGQFQFKSINSVLAVVKVVDDDSMLSHQSSRQASTTSKRSMTPLKKIFSFKKKAVSVSADIESSAKYDDEKIILDLKKTVLTRDKKKKNGDLPPKTPQTPVIRISSPPSSCATASDVEPDEVISAVSTMSELSMRSVGEKASWLRPTIIPSGELTLPITICFRKKVPIKKFEVIKRRLSFTKGKF